ncbi:MAG: RNA methyltransferase [Proteobacteria bacterium]|nr:RNA methyltransferase [Pseudomonadota bacterium]
MAGIDKNIKRRKNDKADFRLFATTAAGLEDELAAELRGIGVRSIDPAIRGIGFTGDIETIYRANLWLRTAHRVLLELDEFEATDREALYEGVSHIHWSDHLSVNGTLAVDTISSGSNLSHTQFVSQVVKDAIVDGFRRRLGRRPNVDQKDPDLQLNARLSGNRCTLSIDTSGKRLHRRGYRPDFGVQAPLKETLAAGILLKSGYDGSMPLIDPMCGSGTFLVEGALIAKNIAPGLLGRRFGFMRGSSFDQRIWKNLTIEAKAMIRRDKEALIVGSDISEETIRATGTAAQGAGVDDAIRLRRANLSDLAERTKGMVVTNPPYGERLGEMEELAELYRTLGNVLKQRCRGMTAHVLTSSKFLSGKIGLRPKNRDVLWNGAIECRLLHYDLY